MAPLFEHYGIQLWTPEVGGRIDWHAEDHEQTMLALGLPSKREIARTRIRVRTAMATQTREQGRYLGGRPPYGYRLADAGPHPNKAHAAWGRRAHRLEPDPDTAPVVAWMFAQRLAGHSAARITRALNDAGSRARRPPTRTEPAPRRHSVDAADGGGDPGEPAVHGAAGVEPAAHRLRPGRPGQHRAGAPPVQRWNLPEGWVISRRPAHPAIVSEADYIAAQDATAPRGPRARRRGGTCWPGCWPRAAGGGWSRPGPTASPPTGAATGTPAPPAPGRPAEPVHTRGPDPSPAGRPGHLARRRQLAPARRNTPRPGHGARPAEELIDHLRAADVTLIYDPATRTLRTDTKNSLAVTVG